MKKNYISQDDLDYVINCKLKLKGIMVERGWSVKRLCLDTGIPNSTLSLWLDTESTVFPAIPSLSAICRVMKIPIQDVLADPMWITIDEGRYLFVRPWMEEPIEQVRIVTEFYYKLKAEFKKTG